MSFNSRKLIFGTPQFTDPFWNNTVLLLHGDGIGATPNGQQNNTFLDSSSNNFTITRNGTPSQGSFGPFALNGVAYSPSLHGGSGYFSTTSDLLTIPASSSFYPTDTAWTIESYVYLRNAAKTKNTLLYVGTGQSLGISLNRTGIGDTYIYIGTGGLNPWGAGIISSSNLTFNTWNHIALVRNGSTVTLYHNGINVGSVANVPSGIVGTSTIGNIGNGGLEYFDGYISNLRVTKGLAVYTSNFTPPTSPVTLTSNGGATPSTATTSGQVSLLCNFTNAGIFDSTEKNVLTTFGDAKVSTSVVKYGTGAMYFDGTGDYLTAPNTTSLSFGTGDFTVECWFNANSLSPTNYSALMGFHNSSNTNTWGTYVRSDGVFLYGSGATMLGGGTINTGTWYHFAATRSGNTARVFLNGIQQASAAVTGSYVDGGYLFQIAEDNEASNLAFNGYIDDLRITKGVARYTANFTPPTRAFPDK